MANDTIQFKRATSTRWTFENPILKAGEPGYETDTGKEKRGDGVTRWAVLAYVTGSGGGTTTIIGGPSTFSTLTDAADALLPVINQPLATALAARVPLTRQINGVSLTADISLTKSNVGLTNVDNTADVNKPVSSIQGAAIQAAQAAAVAQAVAQIGSNSGSGGTTVFTGLTDATTAALPTLNAPLQTALAAKVPQTRLVAGQALTSDITISKSTIGLSNVDNVADAAKPVSSAQATAISTAQSTAVTQATTAVLGGTPASALNTLTKISTSLGGDAAFATTTTTALDGKLANTAYSVGTTNLADSSVTSAKLAALTTKTYLGRSSAGTGVVEGVPAATLITDLGVDLKADKLAPVNITGATALTSAANANRLNKWTGSVTQTLTLAGNEGDFFAVANLGSVTISFASATSAPLVAAPTGYKNTAAPYETAIFQLLNGSWVSSTPSLAVGGSVSGALTTVTGGTTVGSVLTCAPIAGLAGTYQWKRGSTNVGTASTYTLVTADMGGLVMTCVFTPTTFTAPGVTTGSGTPVGSLSILQSAGYPAEDDLGNYADGLSFGRNDAISSKPSATQIDETPTLTNLAFIGTAEGTPNLVLKTGFTDTAGSDTAMRYARVVSSSAANLRIRALANTTQHSMRIWLQLDANAEAAGTVTYVVKASLEDSSATPVSTTITNGTPWSGWSQYDPYATFVDVTFSASATSAVLVDVALGGSDGTAGYVKIKAVGWI